MTLTSFPLYTNQQCVCIGAVVTAGCLVGVAQSSCSQVSVLVWCAMALVLGIPAAFSSFLVNGVELAPNHAAAIAGLSGTVGAAVQVLSPLYVGYLTAGQVRKGPSLSVAYLST